MGALSSSQRDSAAMEDLRTRVKGLVGAERLPSLDHVVSDWLIRNPFQLEGVTAEEADGEKGEEVDPDASRSHTRHLLHQLDAWLDARPKSKPPPTRMEGEEETVRKPFDVKQRLLELERDLFPSSSGTQTNKSNRQEEEMDTGAAQVWEGTGTHTARKTGTGFQPSWNRERLRTMGCIAGGMLIVGIVAIFYYFAGSESIGQINDSISSSNNRTPLQDEENGPP